MPVKKIKEAIAKTNKDLNLSGDLVEDLAYFYYSQLRSHLSSMDDTAYLVQGIGLFKIQYNSLKKLIEKEKLQHSRMKDEVAKEEIMRKIVREEEVFRDVEVKHKEKIEFYENKRKIKEDYRKQK